MIKVNLPNMQAGFEAIIFDLDGTLVDSYSSIEASWKAWCNRHDLDYEEVNKLSFGMRTQDSIRMFLPDCNLDEEIEILEEYECTLVEGVKAFAGANPLIDKMLKYNWAIATSGSTRVATRRLEIVNLPKPDVLVSADHVKSGKPDPEPYLLAAKQLSVDPERCLVVEDSIFGIQAGKRANMKVIGVASSHSVDELNEANLVLDSIEELNRAICL